MKTRFLCPHCRAVLNPGARIVFIVRYGEIGGLMLLHPEPGTYKYQCDRPLREGIKEGDTVDFYCPVCTSSLVSPSAKTMVEMVVEIPHHKTRVARFSRVCGEHATFISDGRVVDAYGEHVRRYQDIDFSDFEWRW
jgi:hypothetical protein